MAGQVKLKDPITVTITGAAGQIAYSLLFVVGNGDIFGVDQPIILKLLDIEAMQGALDGVVMELEDCSFPLLVDIVPTLNPNVAFADCDVAILVGAIPRRDGMERKDLLTANAKIFKTQGSVIDKMAKKSVKVLIVGNPANTNALITSHFAPSISPSQFTCLTQLDLNRSCGMIARRLKVSAYQVRNIIIWGNHSATQYPDVEHAYVQNPDGTRISVREAVNDDAWLHGAFVKEVQGRGAAVIKARKLSSALSAAKAIADHMRVWWCGTAEGEITSMGVMSDGSYGIREGVFYSHPVTIKDGVISIVKDLPIDEFSREMMNTTSEELFQERDMAMSIVS